MMKLSAMTNLDLDNQHGFSRSTSDAPPTHYTVTIESFSLLTKNNIERYDSSDFVAGGYKWKLVLYPNGNKNKNVKEHLSVYLAMADVSSLGHGWEVYAVFRFFLLDQNKDNYLTLEDTDSMGKGRRFYGTKLEWGFDHVIPLKAFNDASNGYLVDDTCVFGAEVFVCKERSKGKAECLSMVKEPITYKHTWKIENFWKLDEEWHDSKTFHAGNQKCFATIRGQMTKLCDSAPHFCRKIRLYPNGKGPGTDSHLSLYVVLADPTSLLPGSKIFAEYTLRMLDQLNAKHHSGKANYWFSASSRESGWPRFISEGYFSQPRMGFLMKDSCWVEAEVTIIGVANALG